jgi:tetratricopeptide (TPR) repeat protein
MAFHYDTAEDYERALPAYERAAVAAQAVYAHEEAIRHLQRAIALVPETQADPMISARLYETLGINLVNAGRFEMARSAYRQAIDSLSPETGMSLVRLNWRLARTYLSQLYYGKAESQLDNALTVLESPPAQGEAAWRHLWLDIQLDRLTLFAYLFDIGRFDALSQEIAPVIEKLGTLKHRLSYSSKLYFIGLVKNGYRPSSETFAILDKHLELACQSQDPRDVVFAQFSKGYCLLHADEIKSAEEWIQKSLDQTRQLDLRVHEARCLAFLSTVYRRLGEIERTAEYAQLAAQKGTEVGSRHYVAHSLANSAWLAYHRGETDLAVEKARKAVQDFLKTKVPLAWLALIVLLAIYCDTGDFDQAIDAAEAMLDPLQQRLPDKLDTALESAVYSWNQQDDENTRQFLEQAVQLAKERGYL